MIYMMVGIPASGKSTKAMEMAMKLGCPVISSDQLRKEEFGDANLQFTDEVLEKDLHREGSLLEVEKLTYASKKILGDSYIYRLLRQRAKEAAKKGDVIVDSTFSTKFKRRTFFLKDFKGCDVTAVVMEAGQDINLCLARNALRGRHVPKDVMMKQYEQFEMPELSEGFVRIVTIPAEK